MKTRPKSACRSRTTPLTARPTSAQHGRGSGLSRKSETSPTRSIRFHDPPSSSSSSAPIQKTKTISPTFVTNNKSFTSSILPTLESHNSAPGEDQLVPQTENKSARLLKGLVAAEVGFGRTSILEQLIGSYLRMKSDVKVLRDFSSFCLTTPQDIDTNVLKMSAQELFSSHMPDNTRLVHILKLNDLRDKLLFDLCSGLLVEKNMGMKDELEPLPESCSPRLMSLLTFFGTFLDIAKEVASKRNKDPQEEKNAQQWQEKCNSLEQAYSALKSDAKAIKAKYDNIMTDGGKHQGMARQQHTIDELELKVKILTKQIEDADNTKKMALKSELKMRDDVLQLQTQLDALKETYEGELGSLKPLVHEQVSYTHDNLKEIRKLTTNLLLSKERYSLLNTQFEDVTKEFQRTKSINSDLERNLELMTDKANTLESNGIRLEKLLKVTAAAKISSDEATKDMSARNEKLSCELNSTKATLHDIQQVAATLTEQLQASEENGKEWKRLEEELTTKYEAKCCEVVSLEGALDEQAGQVESMIRRMQLDGGGGGVGVGQVNFNMKIKSERNVVIGRRNRKTSSLIPQIGQLEDSDDVMGDVEKGESDKSDSGKRSKWLGMLSEESNEKHQQELNKKDHKIRKLEEKLRKSQALLKDALDRVWQLEKVKLDEAAGVIPSRRGTLLSDSRRQRASIQSSISHLRHNEDDASLQSLDEDGEEEC